VSLPEVHFPPTAVRDTITQNKRRVALPVRVINGVGIMIDSVALASITSAVAALGNDYLKGVAGEAGKSSWIKIKSLLGWISDPVPADIPEKVATALAAHPENTETLLNLFKSDPTGSASALVGKIEATGGKIVVATSIVTDRFQM
jgi:hypothetical protein